MGQERTNTLQESGEGRRLLLALGMALAVAAGMGSLGYMMLRAVSQDMRMQSIAFLVYAALTMTLWFFFKPTTQPPIEFRYTGLKYLLASIAVLFGTLLAAILLYYLLGSVLGSFRDVTKQIVGFATDAKRLQGKPLAAWGIAVPRGCLLAPLFEEVLFRGLLLSWLLKHLREELAIIIIAALFALGHGSFLLAPYALLFGITMGYVKLRTGSALNTWIMHCLHSVILLSVGLMLFPPT